MIATAYRGVPTLADYFLELIRQGLFPDDAAGHLTAEIRREHLVLDPHPRWPFHLTPTTDGRLIVETANGRRDDASEFLISIERTGRHTTIFVADPPSAPEPATIASTFPEKKAATPKPTQGTPVVTKPVTVSERRKAESAARKDQRQKQRAKRVAKVTKLLMKKPSLKKVEETLFAECEKASPDLGVREYLEGLRAARAQIKKKSRSKRSRK